MYPYSTITSIEFNSAARMTRINRKRIDAARRKLGIPLLRLARGPFEVAMDILAGLAGGR